MFSHQIINHANIKFGTSGARGLVADFTPLVCSAFTASFMQVMRTQFSFTQVALAIDNRPSSDEMVRACASQLQVLGIESLFFGVIPTPALAYQAMQIGIPAIMITGSHIPFDRNGLKFYRPDGEINKQDEQAIIQAQAEVSQIAPVSSLPIDPIAATNYASRYTTLFASNMLAGQRIGIYEHSSAGRDLYAKLFASLGAQVIVLERSDHFVPIDTEAVSEQDTLKAQHWSAQHQLDAIFSTDGDGDRPLLADETGTWLRGDLLCLLAAKALKINGLAVPVSCNTAIELSHCFDQVTRTKIGSPHVIDAFDELKQNYQRIAGFEANGGFMLGSDIRFNHSVLTALPTRDALLPALMVLYEAKIKQSRISDLVRTLPERFTASDRIQDFAAERSHAILETGAKHPDSLLAKLKIKGEIRSVDLTDGLRINLQDDRILHLRPSGNAPELRCYAESDSPESAAHLVESVLNEILAI
jgi:phosphomannomutase